MNSLRFLSLNKIANRRTGYNYWIAKFYPNKDLAEVLKLAKFGGDEYGLHIIIELPSGCKPNRKAIEKVYQMLSGNKWKLGRIDEYSEYPMEF